jgi:hypothetical protein
MFNFSFIQTVFLERSMKIGLWKLREPESFSCTPRKAVTIGYMGCLRAISNRTKWNQVWAGPMPPTVLSLLGNHRASSVMDVTALPGVGQGGLSSCRNTAGQWDRGYPLGLLQANRPSLAPASQRTWPSHHLKTPFRHYHGLRKRFSFPS